MACYQLIRLTRLLCYNPSNCLKLRHGTSIAGLRLYVYPHRPGGAGMCTESRVGILQPYCSLMAMVSRLTRLTTGRQIKRDLEYYEYGVRT